MSDPALKIAHLVICFAFRLDAYHERKKILQHELQALEREAEARWIQMSCWHLFALSYYYSISFKTTRIQFFNVLLFSGMSELKQLLMQPQHQEKAGNMYVCQLFYYTNKSTPNICNVILHVCITYHFITVVCWGTLKGNSQNNSQNLKQFFLARATFTFGVSSWNRHWWENQANMRIFNIWNKINVCIIIIS